MDNGKLYALQIVLDKEPTKEFLEALENFVRGWFENFENEEIPKVKENPLDLKSRVYLKYDKNYDVFDLIETLSLALKTPPHKIEEKYIKPLAENKNKVLIYEGPLEICLEIDKFLVNGDLKTELRLANDDN